MLVSRLYMIIYHHIERKANKMENEFKTESGLSWHDVLVSLQTTHTTSIRKICQDLKCHRTWVNKYIVPYVSDNAITLANGYGSKNNNGNTAKVNWCWAASAALGKEIRERTWIDTDKYLQFLLDNVRCSRQTIRVPLESFFTPGSLESYKKKENILFEQMDKALKEQDFKLAKDFSKLIEQSRFDFMEEQNAEFLKSQEANPRDRNKLPAVPVSCPWKSLKEVDLKSLWMAPHDIKEYGDVDENIYRRFFSTGCIRLSFEFENEDGTKSQKVFYVEDPDKKESKINEFVTVGYSDWLAFQAAK